MIARQPEIHSATKVSEFSFGARYYKNVFEELEHYDRTREKLWVKERIDITLTLRIIKKLEKLKKKTGKPISHLIEEMIENYSAV